MAVTYTQTLSADMIVSEIENLLDWRNSIMRRSFYPQAQMQKPEYAPPSALLAWCQKEADRQTMDRKMCDRLMLVYQDLAREAQKVIDHEGALPVEIYDSFSNQFDGYISQVRRLQQDLADTAGAVDTLTGLRTVSGLRNEIRREQDRFDRKGTSFSIASIEIDNLDALTQKHDRRQMDSIYASVAHLIARTVRSFDDAYYLGRGEYLIILKHVEFMDACSVMDRLRKEIDMTPVGLPSGDRVELTASFGIAEAQQREQSDQVVEHAKQARLQAKGAGGNRVAEYMEKSALEQYARDFSRRD